MTEREQIEALREDLARAHALVHGVRAALVVVLRTKSFEAIRQMIGQIDQWKKAYAEADAIERGGKPS